MSAQMESIPAKHRFGEVLRGWRRARRLSQLDLAMTAEISQRHLSFMESGRARPSREMVIRLAEAMEVPVRDRNNLLQAAGFAGSFRQRGLDEADMAPVKRALDIMLSHHEPYPAIVVDRDWNGIMANSALPRAFSALGDINTMWMRVCGDGPHNLMRLTFHPEGLRPLIENWDEAAPMFLQRLHREAAATGSPTLTAYLDELRGDPGIPRHWSEPDPHTPLPPVLPLRLRKGELRVALFSMISTFGTPQDVTTDELRVETFFPADDATDRLLHGLAENVSADA